MALHNDQNVDRAMRANIGKGFHFFDPDNSRFHRSTSVAGVASKDQRYVYVIERYKTATLGGHVVQVPHSRVIRVDLESGETDYMTRDGKPTSEMIGDKYVTHGEKHEYSTNAQAYKAARLFAGIDRVTLRLPSIKVIAAELRAINSEVDFSDDGCDVRLQVYADGTHAVRWGASDYDQDHRGYWGASSVPGGGKRFQSKEIARDLIDQVSENYATSEGV